MSLTRRLAAVLPAAGVTVLAALALAGTPAAAAGDEAAARAQRPAVMTTPCAEGQRDEDCGYGYGGTPGAATTGPTRGNGGYGGESPTASPTPSRTTPTTPATTTPATTTPATPTASVDTVPPGGELPVTSPAATPSETTPGGVSAGGTLPKTGAPMGMTMAIGALMVAAGAGAVFYTRRRRHA
ncbi:hypothetical protein Asp14428_64120 [Actinoplanes sp. NBRC 14428]|uniref:LPXTG-motif cell wall-anchored protein n=1 Tax=Pseudosporangium ferrugineum TaxID=439699 RepID=A0A2T0RU60_9ACTN|nr:LPXTG cell wall anchor domain-containing protein [Pseudosporangium ferrugineum]PRY24687.1 LPXTG-motif cell wall-anchored protein [Pseudosporangium ferrugineum]BCJ54937.1 hypothetical protein Asp14428_64120 [Actinoplanes sp. NBRC 14428]